MSYKQYFAEGYLGSTSGYVEYTITPDFDPIAGIAIIAVGEEVTITGTVYSAGQSTKSIIVNLRSVSDIDYSGSYWSYQVASLTKSISKGSRAEFEIKFTIPDNAYQYNGRVTIPLYINFKLNASYGYSVTTPSQNQCIYILKTRLNPYVIEADFVRCNADGTNSDSGSYIKVAGLKLGLASGLSYSDIVDCYLRYTDNGREAELDAYTLVNEGYSETVPTLLEDYTFSGGQAYTFTVNICDNYDWFQIDVDMVPVAFANMHLSGATSGGVAFGMFSSSEDDNPKLESVYPAYFYGGIAHVKGIAMNFSTDEQITGRKWFDGKPIYQITYYGSTTADGEKETINYMPPGFETIIKIEGTFYSEDTSRWYNIPHFSRDGSGYSLACFVETAEDAIPGSIVLNVGSSLNGTKHYYITVYYTKS